MSPEFLPFFNGVLGGGSHLRVNMIPASSPSLNSRDGESVSGRLIMPGPHKRIANILNVRRQLHRGMLGMPETFMADRVMLNRQTRRLSGFLHTLPCSRSRSHRNAPEASSSSNNQAACAQGEGQGYQAEA
jgi:hypothetical protein